MKRVAVIVLILLAGCGGGSTGGGEAGGGSSGGGGGAAGGELFMTTSVPVGVLADVWVFAANDVWIAGSEGLAHWDGATVTKDISSAPGEKTTGFVGLWGKAPNDLYAVSGLSVVHWDGAKWETIATTEQTRVASLGCVYAEGEDLWVGGARSSARLRAGSWTRYETGAADLWGSGGQIISPTHRFDAGGWSPLADAPAGLQVSGTAPADLWTTTNSATIHHYDGARFTPVALELGSQATVQAVYARSINDVYAGGYRETIAHYDGNAWTVVHQGAPNSLGQLRAMHGAADGTIWAVGVRGPGAPFALRNR